MGLIRGADAYFAAMQHNPTRVGCGEPEHGLHDFATAGAHKPVYPQNFSLAYRETDIGKLLVAGQSFEPQDLRTDLCRTRGKHLLHRAAHRERDELIDGGISNHPCAHRYTVSIYGIPVGDG
jgi:hypothetical protein